MLYGNSDGKKNKVDGSSSTSLTKLDNYGIKDHKLANGSVLLEFKNKNSVPIDVKFKVEFLDAKEEVVDVDDIYLFSIPSKGLVIQ